MRRAEYPFLVDWFSITFRWLVLISAAFSVFALGSGTVISTLVIVIWICWNLWLTWLAIMDRRMRYHRFICSTADLLAAGVLSLSGGAFFNELTWISIIPLFPAGMYFGRYGGLISAIAMIIIQFIGSVPISGITSAPVVWIFISVFYIITGILFGLLGGVVYRMLRQRYEKKVIRRNEATRVLILHERERLESLYTMIDSLNETLVFDEVLDRGLNICISSMFQNEKEITRLISAILLFNADGFLDVAVSHGLQPADRRETINSGYGQIGNVLKKSEPMKLEFSSDDVELWKLQGLSGFRSIYCLPLQREHESFGVMLIAHQTAEFFNEGRTKVLEMVSKQMVISLQNALLFQQLDKEKQQFVTNLEFTRMELARDLEEGPSQQLFDLNTRIDLLKRKIGKNNTDFHVLSQLESLKELAEQTKKELFYFLFILNPEFLEKNGLFSALEQLVYLLQDTWGLNIMSNMDRNLTEKFTQEQQMILFQLIEEGLTNVRKHAQATSVQLTLKPLPEQEEIALVEIRDNGKGFSVEAYQSDDYGNANGFKSLIDRTDLLDGVLRIGSRLRKGTRLQVLIPVSRKDVELLRYYRNEPVFFID